MQQLFVVVRDLLNRLVSPQNAGVGNGIDDLVAKIRSFVAHKVAEGFHGPDQVIDQAVALFARHEAYSPVYWDLFLARIAKSEEEHSHVEEDAIRPHVERVAADLFQERKREEQRWTVPTDCDRLDRAFEQLSRESIMTRQNLPCCMNCALAEIRSAIARAKGAAGSEKIEGFVFYHEQDTAVAPHGKLFLAYGSPEEDKGELVGIGKRIVEVLNSHGLRTDWDGNPGHRIVVVIDWRKRRYSAPL